MNENTFFFTCVCVYVYVLLPMIVYKDFVCIIVELFDNYLLQLEHPLGIGTLAVCFKLYM